MDESPGTDLAASYLGPSAGPAARTADAVVVMDDGELPVHSARLCLGVLEEAVALALDNRQMPANSTKLLRIPVPGCSRDDVALFLRLIYSIRPDSTAKTWDLEVLLRAGLVAHKLEQLVLAKCCLFGSRDFRSFNTPFAMDRVHRNFKQLLS